MVRVTGVIFIMGHLWSEPYLAERAGRTMLSGEISLGECFGLA